MARANFYGKTIDEHGDREKVGAETLVDLELNYKVDGNITVIAGPAIYSTTPGRDRYTPVAGHAVPTPHADRLSRRHGPLAPGVHPRLADHLSRGSGEAPGPSWSGGPRRSVTEMGWTEAEYMLYIRRS